MKPQEKLCAVHNRNNTSLAPCTTRSATDGQRRSRHICTFLVRPQRLTATEAVNGVQDASLLINAARNRPLWYIRLECEDAVLRRYILSLDEPVPSIWKQLEHIRLQQSASLLRS